MRHVIFKTLFFIGHRENTLDLGLDLDLRKFSQGFEEYVLPRDVVGFCLDIWINLIENSIKKERDTFSHTYTSPAPFSRANTHYHPATTYQSRTYSRDNLLGTSL